MVKVKKEQADEVLVVAAILGDLGAFDELVKRYRAVAVRTAQAIVGREQAEDVAQDALLLAFKALPSIEDPSRFASWLLVITRHRALRYNKQERKHHDRYVELDGVLLDQFNALSHPETVKEENEVLRQALDSLPDEFALVLRLRFFDEMPLKRIGASLDVPESTVKWRIYRGKQLMRKQLEQISRGRQWKKIKN